MARVEIADDLMRRITQACAVLSISADEFVGVQMALALSSWDASPGLRVAMIDFYNAAHLRQASASQG